MKVVSRVSIKLLSFFLCALLLMGCSSSESVKAHQLHTVEIRTMKFQPADLTARKGDTIVFINRDFMVHDVTEAESKRWNSIPLETNKSYRMVVSTSESYYCSFHPVMKGNIIVE